jgi:diketogulonate reductase-like aldo/keto reductase
MSEEKLAIDSKLKLPNGEMIPIFGRNIFILNIVGTYLSKSTECYDSVISAIKNGYVHVDTYIILFKNKSTSI